eukprot:SAG22_NODE_816_length_7028_cov_32.309280_7_plen_69_part_00
MLQLAEHPVDPVRSTSWWWGCLGLDRTGELKDGAGRRDGLEAPRAQAGACGAAADIAESCWHQCPGKI